MALEERIPGSTVFATPTELEGLRNTYRQLEEHPEWFEWTGPLQKPPGWDQSMDLLKTQAAWAAGHGSAEAVREAAERLATVRPDMRNQLGLGGDTDAVTTPLRAPVGGPGPGGAPMDAGVGGSGRVPLGAANPANTTERSPTMSELDDRVIAMAGGDGLYSWDEWNWFYSQASGLPGPAPEDRGLTRSEDGSVYIGGGARYHYATWKRYAFPTEIETAGGRVTGEPAPASLLAWIVKLLRAVVCGGKA